MEELEEPRPSLQGITFAPAQHESDGLDAGGPEVGVQPHVSEVCEVRKVPVLENSKFTASRRFMAEH